MGINSTHGYMDLAYCNKYMYSLKLSFNLCLGYFCFDRAEYTLLFLGFCVV